MRLTATARIGNRHSMFWAHSIATSNANESSSSSHSSNARRSRALFSRFLCIYHLIARTYLVKRTHLANRKCEEWKWKIAGEMWRMKKVRELLWSDYECMGQRKTKEMNELLRSGWDWVRCALLCLLTASATMSTTQFLHSSRSILLTTCLRLDVRNRGRHTHTHILARQR